MAAPLTEEEVEILQKFRKKVYDIEIDEIESHDLQLIRWPRARNYDLDRAERMMRRAFEWRKEFDYDNILDWVPPKNYDLFFPYQISGHDEVGSPVIIIPVCEWDSYVKKELNEGRKELVNKYVIQITAKLVDDVKKLCKPKENIMITDAIVIFDLNNFGLRHLTSVAVPEVLLESFRIFERNFPETLRVAYVINAPSLFALLWPLVKKMLADKTTGKVQLFDRNTNKWKKALLSVIPKSQIPFRYGGEQPDILQKKVDAAKQICDSGGLGMSGISLDSLTTANVGAGSKLVLDYEVNYANTKLSWIFKTQSHDIGFSITHGKKEIVAKKRANAQIIQEGFVICKEPGTYTVNFENTYSLFRGKTLHYLITLETLEDNLIPT